MRENRDRGHIGRLGCAHLSSLGTVAVAGLLACGVAQAAPEVRFDGQVRVRPEVDRRVFDSGAAALQFTDLRARLGVRATMENNTHAYVQIQDSRRFGGVAGSGAETSGTLANGTNLDAHQAYLQIDRFLSDDWGIQAGRFEVALGNERVFGAVDWSNVGRSWDGIRTFYALPAVTVDGYWLKRLERNDTEENRDFDLFGLRGTVPGKGVEVFVFFENDAKVSNGPGAPGSLERFDIGLYGKRTYGRLDVETNLVYQTGTQEFGPEVPLGAEGDPTDVDLAAYLVTAELGLGIGDRSRIAVGVDYASGDDDANDDTIETYDNLYYTGHKFRGFMDYFVASQTPGLVDLMVRGSTSPATGWTLKGDLHFFQTAVEYTSFEQEKTRDLGIEIDLGASTTRVPGARVDLGASLFLPSEAFAGESDPDPGLWFYTALVAGF